MAGGGSAAVSAVGVVLKNPPRLVRQDRLRETRVSATKARKAQLPSVCQDVAQTGEETSTKQIIPRCMNASRWAAKTSKTKLSAG